MPFRLMTERIELAAERFPDRIAFSSQTTSVTYAELLQATLSVGTFVGRVLPRLTPVCILMQREVWAVEAILGVMQSNLIAAPLDPTMPAQRMLKVFETLQPGCLLIDDSAAQLAKALQADYPCPVLHIRDALACQADLDLIHERKRFSSEIDPIEIFYTSGSTGQPKGVVHTNRSMLSYVERTTDFTEYINSDQVYGNQAPFFYAHAQNDIFISVYNACTVHIIPDHLFKFPQALVDYLNEKQITTIIMTPTNYIYIADAGVLSPGCLPHLQSVYISGEATPWSVMETWRDAACNAGICNFYGSTENPYNTFYLLGDDTYAPGEIVSSGPPLMGIHILLLDEDGQEVAPGEVGEIYTASPWLSSGYYHNPQLTRTSFLRDPMGCGWDVIYYRTGDLGRFDERGHLRLQGRKDTQIKHRGYRMDLGEVEAALRSVEGWQHGCCLFSEEEDLLYCFWIGPLAESDLQTALKSRLERYMLPNVWVHLEELPHTATGKLDRMALKAAHFGQHPVK